MTQSSHQNLIHLVPTVRRPRSQGECALEFIEAMLQKGIDFSGEILADGEIHRFASGEKGNKNCWYVFQGTTGTFGDWSRNINEKCSLMDGTLSSQDPGILLQQKVSQLSKEEIWRSHEEAAYIASKKWESFAETGESSYLKNKKVEAFGVRFHGDFLIIPLRDRTGKLWSLQWISPEGTKRFLAGGLKKGCFHHMGALEYGKPFYITEGYSTGASVHMATHQATVVAFDAGNLEPVVEELREAYPGSPLIKEGTRIR